MKSRDGIVKVYRTSYGTYKVRFYDEDGKPRDKSCKTITDRDALVRAIRKREDLDYWFPPAGAKCCKVRGWNVQGTC